MSKLWHGYGSGSAKAHHVKGKAAPKSAKGAVLDAPATPFTVIIYQRDPPQHSVTAALGPTPPLPTEGGGGWEEVQMPKRGSVLIWRGRGLLKLAFPILFDNFSEGQPVGPEYTTLLHMYRPLEDTEPPSVVKIAGQGDTLPFQGLDFVITELGWDAGSEANERGQRTQQILNVTLSEFRPDERLKTAAAGKKGKTITVEIHHDGESLGKIADQHHVKGGWKALGKLQHPPIKDPRHTHKGEKIRVPVG